MTYLVADVSLIPGPRLDPDAGQLRMVFVQQDAGGALRWLGDTTGVGSSLAAVSSGEVESGVGACTSFVVQNDSVVGKYLVVGLGVRRAADDPPTGDLMLAVGAAARCLSDGDVALLDVSWIAGTEEVRSVAVAAMLGLDARWRSKYRKGDRSAGPRMDIVSQRSAVELDRVRSESAAVCEAVAMARELVDHPPSYLTPQRFAELARDVAAEHSLECRVFEPADLRELGCNGILSVGGGSVNSPRMVRLGYSARGAGSTLLLVGKGITFDSGGLCIKTGAGMLPMKSDMAGAAAVLGALAAIASLQLSVNVVAYLPLAENMPGGGAYRPGDVITAANGSTVEIIDTDAEGRIVLADALAIAERENAGFVVDLATLTGAQRIALGGRTAALLSPCDDFADLVLSAAAAAGEGLWRMPLLEEEMDGLRSRIADIRSMAHPRYAAMQTGALFLSTFMPDGACWAHLDITACAFNDSKPFGFTGAGGTGWGVRMLVQLASAIAKSPPPPHRTEAALA